MLYHDTEDDSLQHEREGCNDDSYEEYERTRDAKINQEPAASVSDGLIERKRMNPHKIIKPMER